jgi:hypothetical protein
MRGREGQDAEVDADGEGAADGLLADADVRGQALDGRPAVGALALVAPRRVAGPPKQDGGDDGAADLAADGDGAGGVVDSVLPLRAVLGWARRRGERAGAGAHGRPTRWSMPASSVRGRGGAPIVIVASFVTAEGVALEAVGAALELV